MKRSPVRLGIIGCGIAARELHWPALKRLGKEFTIAVVCNHTAKKAREFSRLVGGVPCVLDYREVLAMDDVDAVDIVLPIDLNLEVTKAALHAGKHVIVEKPVAANEAEARTMVSLARRYKRVTMVAENFRYRAIYRRARSLIGNGIVGKPYAATWDIYHRIVRRDNPYARTRWRIHHKYPGGFLTDAGVHNLAALRWLLGDIKKVSGSIWSVNPLIGKVDSMRMQFMTELGVDGTLNLFFASQGFEENRLLIFGRKGTMEIREDRLRILRPGRVVEEEVVSDDGGYEAEFRDFSRAIQTGSEVLSTFEEGFKDLAAILRVVGPGRS